MIWKFWPKRDRCPPTDGSPELPWEVFIISAPSWTLARSWAMGHLQADELYDDTLPDDEEADVELKWEGMDTNDATAPSYPRRMLLRRRNEQTGVMPDVWEEAQV
jgi:hypothetical protein